MQFSNLILQKIATANTDEREDESTTLELDSHADSPVVGAHARIISKTGDKVSVRGFCDEIGKPILVEVVDAVLIYDCQYTGESILLVLRNALHIPSMKVSLIPPFMMRLAGLDVNECPKVLASQTTGYHHSIYSKQDDILIPLKLDGIISYIQCRMPQNDELANNEKCIELTPKMKQWNPHDVTYHEQEEAMMDGL